MVNNFEGLYSIVQEEENGLCRVFRHGDKSMPNKVIVSGVAFLQAVHIAIALGEAEKRGGIRMCQRMSAYINQTEERYYEQRG